jgi:phage repressor protein C with HTH and peptisase S24 domain
MCHRACRRRTQPTRAAPSLIETDVAGDDDFVVYVFDDSMEPLFHIGKVIFVQPKAALDAFNKVLH